MIASEKITEKTRLAQAICLTAHSAVNQKRKYTGDPYWTHPFRVASICLAHNLNEKAICAAYLHDVVEDTGVSLVDIEMMVGKEIADIVFFLTDISKSSDGNRAERKKIDREHIQKGCVLSQSVKCADLIDNTESIVSHDHGFAKIYLKEKALTLSVLTRADENIKKRAVSVLKRGWKSLGWKGSLFGPDD
jgi:(p)ppGpp synthase/HD superfamily hydrolase